MPRRQQRAADIVGRSFSSGSLARPLPNTDTAKCAFGLGRRLTIPHFLIEPSQVSTAARAGSRCTSIVNIIRVILDARRRSAALIRLRVEEFEDLARAFGADTGNLAKIGDRGPLDLL